MSDALKKMDKMTVKEPEHETEETKNLILLGLRAPSNFDSDRKVCMIYPNDCCKLFFWDIMQSIILLVTCVLTPFNMAFSS